MYEMLQINTSGEFPKQIGGEEVQNKIEGMRRSSCVIDVVRRGPIIIR
jgi:hypothetical protein